MAAGPSPAGAGAEASAGQRRILRLSLRSRITLGFALGALALSSALAAITYFTTRSQIVSEELAAVERQALANAQELYGMVSSPGKLPIGGSAEEPLLAILQIEASSSGGSNPVPVSLYYAPGTGVGGWTYASPSDQSLLPASLTSKVIGEDQPAYEVFSSGSTTEVAVGVPIDGLKASYFEVFSLAETSRTLRIILAALAVAGLVTTLAGAVVGRWAAGLALRPLREVSQAALAIASGRLGTRIERAGAPDLAVLASSFNRMVDRLQQRIERDARFTSDVSHELRSPLTTLATSLSVIEGRRNELPDRARQALELVSAEVRRFQRMVGELLEISRFDAGSADFQASVLPIGEVVRRAVGASGMGSVPVEVDPAVEHRKVVVDKRRFERIVTNLLENAERYGGGATRVTVEARDQSVRIAVEDEGPGIAPAERERIFERFARGSVAAGSRGAGGGTGLGLALVLEHVKLHGGRVWAEDRDGPGARFVIELPLAPPEAEEGEGEGVVPAPADGAGQRGAGEAGAVVIGASPLDVPAGRRRPGGAPDAGKVRSGRLR